MMIRWDADSVDVRGAPFGTLNFTDDDDVAHEVPLPCEGEIIYDRDGGMHIEYPFGAWHLTYRGGTAGFEWVHRPSPWVQRVQRTNELRSDVLDYLDGQDEDGRALADRIRRERW